MYNQEKFIEILKQCQGNLSLNEYARISNVDVGYLWRIINKKKNNPPSPKILEKISNTSKGITTYDDLMEICGYIKLTGLHDINLNDVEIIILNEMLIDYKNYLSQNNTIFDKFNEQKYLKKLPDESKNKVLIAFRRNSLDLILNNQNKDTINDEEFKFVSEDDAMYPLLDIGDIALIHRQDYIEDGATLLISMNNSNTIRKFILSEDSSYYTLTAMNACYKNLNINVNEINKIKILGKVIKTENMSAFK